MDDLFPATAETAIPGASGEAAVLHRIAIRLDGLYHSDAAAFWNLLYRLDVPEGLATTALASADCMSTLARVVWKRQQMRIASRAQSSSSAPADPDLRL